MCSPNCRVLHDVAAQTELVGFGSKTPMIVLTRRSRAGVGRHDAVVIREVGRAQRLVVGHLEVPVDAPEVARADRHPRDHFLLDAAENSQLYGRTPHPSMIARIVESWEPGLPKSGTVPRHQHSPFGWGQFRSQSGMKS